MHGHLLGRARLDVGERGDEIGFAYYRRAQLSAAGTAIALLLTADACFSAHATGGRDVVELARALLNEALVEALTEGSGVTEAVRRRRDLTDIAGSWKAEKAIDDALAAQDQVDEALWR